MKVPFAKAFSLFPFLFLITLAASISKLFGTGGGSTAQPYPLTSYAAFEYPAQFSQAAFCDPQPGDTILGAKVIWRGGDGRDVPTIFIAHHPEKGIILSNQGTNKTSKDSVMNDLQFKQDSPDPRFSACLDKGSDVHHGFQETWQHTANDVLAQIQMLLDKHPSSPILVTGHSLGAAVSTINYIYLRCKLPQAKVSAVLFGSPRVGNVNFANSIDKLAASPGNSFQYIINAKDSVPHLPPQALGYEHPNGQVWITKNGGKEALVCPGHENVHCSSQYHLYETQWSHHSAWYFNVNIHGNYDAEGCRIVEHLQPKKKQRASKRTNTSTQLCSKSRGDGEGQGAVHPSARVRNAPTMQASHRLPVELVEHICLLAAEADRKCAYTMAFVSRRTCRQTAVARWRIIALTSIYQYLAFYREVHALPDAQYNHMITAFSDLDSSFASLRLDDKEGTTPFIQHEDTDEMRMIKEKLGRKFKEGVLTLSECMKAEIKELRILRRRRGHSISLPASGEPHESIRHLFIDLPDLVNTETKRESGITRWPDWQDAMHQAKTSYDETGKMSAILIDDYLFSIIDDLRLDHLSMGAGLSDLLTCMNPGCQIKEYTGVYRPQINQFIVPLSDSLWQRPSLRRVHLIGENGEAENSGLEPPWRFLSLGQSTYSPSSVTHLRYDTREPAFHPIEQFASNLRCLLQEITLQPGRYGSLRPLYNMADDAHTRYLKEELKIGNLDYVQFAWEPMSEDADRAQGDLEARLRVAITSLYGWSVKGVESAASFSARRDKMAPNEQARAKNAAFTDISTEDYSRSATDDDRRILAYVKDKLDMEMARQRSLHLATDLVYGIRAPESLIHLGGKAPLEVQDRLALFEERARGGKGAWP